MTPLFSLVIVSKTWLKKEPGNLYTKQMRNNNKNNKKNDSVDGIWIPRKTFHSASQKEKKLKERQKNEN